MIDDSKDFLQPSGTPQMDLLERILDGLAAFDQRFNVTYFNGRWVEYCECDQNIQIGDHLAVVMPAVQKAYLQNCHLALEQQSTIVFETYSDVQKRWLEHSLYPSLSGLTAITRDVTARKLNEQSIVGAVSQVETELQNRTTELESANQDLRQALANKDVLLKTSFALNEVDKLEDAIQRCADILAANLQYDRVTIITFDLLARQVGGYYVGGRGMDAVIHVPFEELWDGLSGWVLRERLPALSPKGILDERESPAVQRRRKDTNCGAVAVIPIIFHESVLGTLTVINAPENRDIRQQDVDILMMLSNQVAQTIENRRLYTSLVSEIDERKRIAMDLSHSQEQLEIRVAERTMELSLANRSLHALSECSQALIRSMTEDELMRSVCNILVSTGGYKMAWVGLVQHDEQKTIQPMAWAGFDEGYLKSIQLSWADNEVGRGPAGVAVRSGQIAIAKNVDTDPNFAVWRMAAHERGFRSVVVIPMKVDEEIIGVLAIYSAEFADFSTAEQTLLTELGSDLAYGLFALRLKAAKLRSEERFTKAFESSPTPQVISRIAGGITLDVNTSSQELFGFTREAVLGEQIQSYIRFVDPNEVNRLKTIMAREKRIRDVETQVFTLAGEVRDVLMSISKIQLEDGLYNLTTFIDITDRKRAEEALRKSQEDYALISANTGDVIWTMDIQSGLFTYVSPSVEKLRGYTVEEVMQQTLSDVMTPDSIVGVSQILEKRIQDFLQGGSSGPFSDEVDQLRKDGSIVNTEVTTAIALNREGKLQVVGVSRDITERKRANDLLMKSEASLEAAQAAAHLGNWELDFETGRGTWSKEMFRMFGIDPAQGVPGLQEFYALIHPDDHALLIDAHIRAVDSGKPVRLEYRSNPNTGEQRYFETQIYTTRDEHGRIQAYGTLLDITRRKRMELEINERVKELTCLNQIGRLLESFNRLEIDDLCQQTVELMVPAMQYVGYAAAMIELNGKRYQTSLYSQDLNHSIDCEIQVNGQTVGRLSVYYTKNLDFIFPEEQSLVDNVARMLGIGLERKYSDTDLRESNERFHQLAQNIQEVFWIFDLKQLKLLYISPAYETVWGRRAASLMANTTEFLESILPEDRSVYLKGLDAQMKGEAVDMEYRIQRPNGAVRWIWDRRAVVYDSIGKPDRSTGVATDITVIKSARQELEELNRSLERRVQERTAELRQSRDDLSVANIELAKASKMKDEFLSSMSHELRTPLTGILGLAETLQLGTYGELQPRQEKALKNIESSGRHLLELINDILDLSKIEAGKLDMQFDLVEVTDVCQASMQLVKGMAQQKRISVNLSMNTPGLVLFADGRRLKQMLVNLLSNAVKFTPEGGKVGLEIEADEENRLARLTVWDNGIGIKQEDLGKLFKPFVQVDSSLSRQYSGTGLGLSLVQRMADLHGGSIQVDSVFGQGSRFTIALPWRPDLSYGSLRAARSEGAPVESLNNLMTIEDNFQDAEQVTRYLQAMGLVNLVHPTARGAVNVAAAYQPSIILLDLYLPDGSGLDVLERLSNEERTRSIPVVVTSVDERRTEAQQAGAKGYLVKPYTQEDLYRELERVSGLASAKDPVLVIAPRPGPPVILLADDNPIILDTLSDFLRAQKYQVYVAHSGYELLEKASEFRADVMLIDIQMPGIDGLETIRRLRAHSDPVVAATPMVAVTALAMTGDRDKILQAGADEYLSKPVSLVHLGAIIQKYLAPNPGLKR